MERNKRRKKKKKNVKRQLELSAPKEYILYNRLVALCLLLVRIWLRYISFNAIRCELARTMSNGYWMCMYDTAVTVYHRRTALQQPLDANKWRIENTKKWNNILCRTDGDRRNRQTCVVYTYAVHNVWQREPMPMTTMTTNTTNTTMKFLKRMKNLN